MRTRASGFARHLSASSAIPAEKRPVYRVTFVLGSFNGARDASISLRVLGALIDALVFADEEWLRAHPETPLLYASGVRYLEEPPGLEDFQDVPTTLAMGIGDCEDLAAWRVAELRVRYGVNAYPVIHPQMQKNGSFLYHITVRAPGYADEDPSSVLGMNDERAAPAAQSEALVSIPYVGRRPRRNPWSHFQGRMAA